MIETSSDSKILPNNQYMSTIYNVYFKDKCENKLDWGEGDRFVLGLELKKLFDAVCQRPETSFIQSDFWWDPAPGTVLGHELLIYCLPDSSQSIIHKEQKTFSIDLTKSGNTFFLGTVPRISEIYIGPVLKYQNSAELLARGCFHELMHNKLEPFDIHTKGGMGLATGGTITTATPLTEENKRLMAKALKTTRVQFKGAL